MLTIKHVTRRGETMTSLAHNVRTSPPDVAAPAGLALLEAEGIPARLSPAHPAKITYEREDGVFCSIDDGTVYVMNENGKTIDTYYLHRQETTGAAQSG